MDCRNKKKSILFFVAQPFTQPLSVLQEKEYMPFFWNFFSQEILVFTAGFETDFGNNGTKWVQNKVFQDLSKINVWIFFAFLFEITAA